MSTHTYPCNQCGAKLAFAAGEYALSCPYCGARNEIAQASEVDTAAALQELDFAQHLAAVAGNEQQIEQQTIKCQACGAESQLAPDVVADRCPFCAAPMLAAKAYAARKIRPRAIAPFEIPEREAKQRFKQWIDGLWFAPNALKQAYRASRGLKGLYLPYWTYDSESETPYRGQRGDHYYVSEQYSENGVSKTRQVQKTRWTPVSGTVGLTFDDVLVPASSSLPAEALDKLEPWRLQQLAPYRDDFIVGFTVEAYRIGLEDGFSRARQRMEVAIEQAIRTDIGGDVQQIHEMQPRYRQITFKHVLLPVWLSAYQYGGKNYRFIVNGQTGSVQGERPWSVWKLFFAGLALLILLTLLYVIGNY